MTIVKWIDVTDKLPENRQRVLTYCPSQMYTSLDLTISVHTYYDDYAGCGKFFVGYNNYPVPEDETDAVYITHWATIPLGPQEGENDV